MNKGLALIGGLLSAGRGFCAFCIRHHLLSRLAEAGPNVQIGDHVRLHGPGHIRIGSGTVIGHHVTLRAMAAYAWTRPAQEFSPDLRIGKDCFISTFSHISCAQKIEIGDRVMIADHCFISDNQHGYQDVSRSIKDQPLELSGPISIGNGSWLGAGVCIAGNVSIGEHCVVGANAVVTHSLPDFSVAVGVPARIVKRFDQATGSWVKTRPDGEFNPS